ncbi:MAG: hypothetical protein Q4B37_08110 [Eubacteriales bacterium]|nr:hypothetical protein [Eubacteriales bacterium]
MRNRKLIPLMLAGALVFSMSTSAYASGTEAEIANIEAERNAAEAELAQAQNNISSLEGQKQELESYLAELSAQYDALTNEISQLSVEAGEKENELKQLKKDLEKAKAAAEKQYEAMKIRIAYMYENGGTSALEMLLSAENFADFLNRANNIMQISDYDRNMLKKYENLQASIKEQEQKAEEEAASINTLMTERSSKQQEVQTLVSGTKDSIASYVSQISATQEEAQALMSQISSADNSIALLVQQAEAERQAEEAAAQQAAEEESQESSEEDYGYDPEEDTTDSSSSSTSSDIVVEEVEEESSQETYTEEEVPAEDADPSSGQGTYLGNFTLTAYCNCAQCCGTAGNLTASGTVPTSGHTVAMAGVPFGTQLLINGTVYTVEDLGTPYGHVDIYFDSHAEALSFGLQSAEVYQL